MPEKFFVYEPMEDSMLILDFIDKNKELFKGKKVLDMGTGSGILGLRTADLGASVVAVDINPKAIEYVKERIKNIKMKGKKVRVQPRVSDLFSSIRKNEVFDIILFNPPYLPRIKGEDKELQTAISGGKHGYEIIERFMSMVNEHLKNDGFILLVFSSLTKKQVVDEIIIKYGFDFELLRTKSFDFETLYLYKIKKQNFLKHKGITRVVLFDRGKRGLVYKAILKTRLKRGYKQEEVIIKALRRETKARESIKREGFWLEKLNKHNIGPKLIYSGEDYLIMEFVKGDLIIDYLESKNTKKQDIIRVIMLVLEQCLLLDSLGITKKEMNHPQKHIIIKKDKNNRVRVVMIDFERTIETKKPKNTTQYLQFLTTKRIINVLKKKGIKVEKDCLIKIGGEYKKRIKEKGIREVKVVKEELINKVMRCLNHEEERGGKEQK